MNPQHLALATALRHELHSHPELSMRESATKARLMDFIREHTRLELLDKGRWFVAVRRSAENAGATATASGGGGIAFRADMDAVPVNEAADFAPYASRCPGVAHKCGHDGHSATLAAFALELDARAEDIGRNVYLLFQHAEETGQGAAECVDFLRENNIGEIYAYHNMPGFAYGAVAVPAGVAQFASRGMIITMTGVKSHASNPEHGRNPAFAIAEVISAIPALTARVPHTGTMPCNSHGILLCTVIQVNVGERAFGTSPGHGELLLTIRGEHEAELNALQAALEALCLERAAAHGLACAFAFEDEFPETRNSPPAAQRVREAAKRLGLCVQPLPAPFRASEDFGHLTKAVPGAMFYLGDGECPPLHTPGFDFPDGLIAIGAELFMELAVK